MPITIFIGITGRWVIAGLPTVNEGNARMINALREMEDSDDVRFSDTPPGFYSANARWEQTEGLRRFDYVNLTDVAPLCQANQDGLLSSLNRLRRLEVVDGGQSCPSI